MSPELWHPSKVRVLLRGQRDSKYVDPIGQGMLSYLEFYNCCYDIQNICHNTMDPIDQLLQVTKQNLQVTK